MAVTEPDQISKSATGNSGSKKFKAGRPALEKAIGVMRAAEASEEQIKKFIEKRKREEDEEKMNEKMEQRPSAKVELDKRSGNKGQTAEEANSNEDEFDQEKATERLKSTENVNECGLVDINGAYKIRF
jgi:selenocysteine lyase/cysteine desulfurase